MRPQAVVIVTVLVSVLGSRTARAQPFNVEQPLVIAVGGPRDGGRIASGDARRRGETTAASPLARLGTKWRTSVGFVVRYGPLVDNQRRIYVVGDSCEVAALAPDGTVVWRAAGRGSQPGPPVILSDGMIVFATGAGEAVGIRDGALVWRSRFGRTTGVHAAPIPLDDGGVIVASGPDIAVLDGRGQESARIVLPDPSSHPLLSTPSRLIVVTDKGGIWSWRPGALQAQRVGDFGEDIDGSATLLDSHTLVAVAASQSHVSVVDLDTGRLAKLVGRAGGLWLGSPIATSDTTLTVLQGTASGLTAVTLDRSGGERGSVLIEARASQGSDKAAEAVFLPLIVDKGGSLAFATTHGSVGVVQPLSGDSASADAPHVELVADVCAPTAGRWRTEPSVVGLAAIAPTGLVAVCRSGLVVDLERAGTAGDSDAPRL